MNRFSILLCAGVVLVLATTGGQWAGGAAAATRVAATPTRTVTPATTTTPLPVMTPYISDYHSLSGEIATTPIQGIDYGISKIIRAAGDYNLESSQALLNLTQAERQRIENWRLYTTTYFELRRLNREYRALERGPRPTEAEIAHIAQVYRPRRLTPSEVDTITGQVAWPIVLQAADFAKYRDAVNKIFADRAAHGVLALDSYLTADRLLETMMDVLREHIYDVPPADFMTARRFLESLAYESRFPAM